ncbi:Fur-regulated basic protein FbpC [Bacillus sp. 179-C3.3 HS]
MVDGDKMTMVFLIGTVCVYSLLIGFVLKGVSKKSAS